MENKKIAALAAGALLIGGTTLNQSANANNLFDADVLGSGADVRENLLQANGNNFIANEDNTLRSIEAKCGEGKCGEKTQEEGKKAEHKCGEGKCGEGKCGEKAKKEGKKAEHKCGEGKCGEKAKKEGKKAEHKCGEGKCGK